MSYFLAIIAVVLAALVVVKVFTNELNWREFWVLLGTTVTLAGFMIAVGSYKDYSDIQVINGQITGKTMERVHCRHSYSCHCYTSCTGSGEHRHCSRHCQTCYDHPFDQDWNVQSTIGSFRIEKIDRQGLKEPPRWTQTVVGEPAHRTTYYKNYIKASPESLFHVILKHNYVIPRYPSNVYDYWKINRIVATNTSLPFAKELNEKLNLALRQLGPAFQVNIVPVFTTYDQNFGEVLQAAWLGGKKNDVVVVTGFESDFKTIKWVKVFSWSKSSLVNYEIQDHLTDLKSFDVDQYVKVVTSDIRKSFIRRPMSDFQYLEDAVEPPDWAIVTSIIIALIIVCGGGFYMTREGVNL